MHVASDSVVLSVISFDELRKLRESWTLRSAVPAMTSASEFFKKKNHKANQKTQSFPLPVNVKCQQLYFAAGTY